MIAESLSDAKKFGFDLPYEEIEKITEDNRELLDEIRIEKDQYED